MQENYLYEYAVIRVVPKVEREEFINAGVIIYCAAKKYLNAEIQVHSDKLRALDPEIDIDEIKSNLEAMTVICRGGTDAGPIGKLDMPGRFRWLTATRSTIIQPSKVHPGLCKDPEEALQKLKAKLLG